MIYASFIVSLCAIGLTIWQALVSRRHNRLSVRPHIISRWGKRRENEGTYFTYELMNVGLGPAMVEEFSLNVPGFSRRDQSISLIEELLVHILVPGKIMYLLKKHSMPSPGFCFVPEEPYLVGEVFLPKPSTEDEQHSNAILQSIEIRLRYASFYGEHFVFPNSRL